MAYRAQDIAKYIINYYHEKGIDITNLKLQKLLYYVQGECLATPSINGACFDDEIQAWKHGPVVPSVYFTYNIFMDNPIWLMPSDGIPEIDEKYKKVIDQVLDRYQDWDPWALVEQTHKENPWKDTYKDDTSYIVIPVEIIRSYFRRKRRNGEYD